MENAIAGSVAVGGVVMESFQQVVDESEVLKPPEIGLSEFVPSPRLAGGPAGGRAIAWTIAGLGFGLADSRAGAASCAPSRAAAIGSVLLVRFFRGIVRTKLESSTVPPAGGTTSA